MTIRITACVDKKIETVSSLPAFFPGTNYDTRTKQCYPLRLLIAIRVHLGSSDCAAGQAKESYNVGRGFQSD